MPDGWLLLAAAAALAAVVVTVLGDWRRRDWIWRNAPHRLIEPPAAHSLLHALVLAVVLGVTIGAALAPAAALSPLALLLAAYAALAVGHRRPWPVARWLGLTLVGAAIVSAALAWSAPWGANLSAGFAVAGVFMQWQARFWSQQLDGGKAWTTTGRLVPAARVLAALLILVQLFALALCTAGRIPAHGVWVGLFGAVALLLHAMMLTRDAAGRRSDGDVLLAGVALLAAAWLLHLATSNTSLPVPLAVGLALAAPLAALRGATADLQPANRATLRIFTCLCLPAAALAAALDAHWRTAPLVWGLVVVAIAAAYAIELRWRPRSAR